MLLYRVESSNKEATLPEWIRESEEYKGSQAASGRWFSELFCDIAFYLNDTPNARVLCVEVEDAEQYRVSNIPMKQGGKSIVDNPRAYSRCPETEFYLPISIARESRVWGSRAFLC